MTLSGWVGGLVVTKVAGGVSEARPQERCSPCLRLFGLLRQSTTDRASHKQQEFITASSGGWRPHPMFPPSRLKHLPNTPPSNNITLGTVISTYECGGNENIQTKTFGFPGTRSGTFSCCLEHRSPTLDLPPPQLHDSITMQS